MHLRKTRLIWIKTEANKHDGVKAASSPRQAKGTTSRGRHNGGGAIL